MTETFTLFPGITLRCFRDSRFKQGCLSVQILRSMDRQEAAVNALIPAVLLRGTRQYPDLRAITLRLDDLYGASVSALVRRIGDYQATGLYCAFMEDRFALKGDEILRPMLDFLGQLLLDPVTRDGGFDPEFVESEKKNLISTIESERNDKRAYAAAQLMRTMCRADSFGVPRLGETEQVEEITPVGALAHYERILKESPIELFYVGSAEPAHVAALLTPLFEKLRRNFVPLPPQSAFTDGGGEHRQEQMDVTQGKLCMGFLTPITNRTEDFAAMLVLNNLFGAGMTSKLFMNVREKLSLCYSVGSGYYGSKGILTVSAGIDTEKETVAREEILRQLEQCCQGNITEEELENAKQAILSGLRGVHDSPGAIENYHGTTAISGFPLTLEEYRAAVERVTARQASQAARTLVLHSSFFLKGVTA